MDNNKFNWLEKVLNEEYCFVKNLKKNDTTEINVLENKSTGKKLVLKRIQGTAEAYAKLLHIVHRNIPVIYDVAMNDDRTIVIEEFIDGITVGQILETGLYVSKGVERVILQVCEALLCIHEEGIVHRDIKPENIIITNDGMVKLIDYDIARIDDSAKSADTTILGTTGYAAPEQYGIAKTDARSDIYSIGILINVMLTGEHPSKKMCSGKWQKIVNKCTRINPDERYQNIRELMNVI